jgi:mRNA interferase RelE/StbE
VEICEVWAVGARADAEVYAEVYAEVCTMATARLRAAGASDPRLAKLADVIERLGRLASDVDVIADKTREPVPGWLAERLIQTAGMLREDVAALDLRETVDRWAAFTSSPQ